MVVVVELLLVLLLLLLPTTLRQATLYGGAKISGPWTRAKSVGAHVWSAPLPKELLDGGGRALFRQLVQVRADCTCPCS